MKNTEDSKELADLMHEIIMEMVIGFLNES